MPASWNFTIHEDDNPAPPVPPSANTADPDFFREPLSDLQGPFLLDDGDRCRLYEDEAQDWYNNDYGEPDHLNPQLRRNVNTVLENPDNWGPFVRWCATAVIKHYRIWLLVRSADAEEPYKALLGKLHYLLRYYVTHKQVGRAIDRRRDVMALERKLTAFLFTKEDYLVSSAINANEVLIDEAWEPLLEFYRLPPDQQAGVEERGHAIMNSVKEQWIELSDPLCGIWDLEDVRDEMYQEQDTLFEEAKRLIRVSKRYENGVLREIDCNRMGGIRDELMLREVDRERPDGQENEIPTNSHEMR